MNLIVPIAGSSSRFPDMKPKWMLTHPRGRMMVIEAISGLRLSDFDRIVFIGLREHEDIYQFSYSLKLQFQEVGIADKAEIILLDNRTKNQPETVFRGIQAAKVRGPLFIKDSDNQFSLDAPNPGNFIAYLDLHTLEKVNARNKSYIQLNEDGLVSNIAEKKILSPYFCVGGYGFESVDIFSSIYEKLSVNDDLYISHMIFQILLDGGNFKGVEVHSYADWGTIKEWDDYKSQYTTLFVDLDGTLVLNSGQYTNPGWGETDGIHKNIAAINALHATGKVEVIITTSRKESFRNVTVEQLDKLGIKYDQIIFELVHGKRIVINDYAKTNPYKSCDAVNLKRNSDDLSEMLEDSLGFKIS